MVKQELPRWRNWQTHCLEGAGIVSSNLTLGTNHIMKSNFCRYMTNQIKFEFDEVMPCCWIKKKFPINQIDQYQQWLSTTEDFSQACDYCLDLENKSIASPRLASFQYPGALFNADANQDEVTAIEFQIDNECNSACIMCGEHASTTWAKYNLSNNSTGQNKSARYNINLKSQFRTLSRLRLALKHVDLTAVKHVAFIGGEPLLNNRHLEILEILKTHVPLENLQLRYITNASQSWSEQNALIWQQSKKTTLVLSVDAIGQQFNYQRWPLQWHQVEKNIEQYLIAAPPNVTFRFSVTLTPLTIFYYDQVEQWIKLLHQKYPNSIQINALDFFPHAAQGTFALNAIPPKLKEKIYAKFGPEHKMSKIIPDYDHDRCVQMIRFIEQHDIQRGLDWRQTFSDIQDCFQ